MTRDSSRLRIRIFSPLRDFGGFGFFNSRSLRGHYPQIAEMLEELYDRSAESCALFVNISEVDKYSVTCTVCRHFDSTGCGSSDLKVPSIIKLLENAKRHDNLH